MNQDTTVFIVPVCLPLITTINVTAIAIIIFTPPAPAQAETLSKDN
jgi:hypothetical protein